MNSGKKYDEGKPRWSLIPWGVMQDVVSVLQFGADKYGEGNWKSVPDARIRYFNAALRHVLAWHDGGATDPDTGKSHLAHATCCLLFLMWIDKGEK